MPRTQINGKPATVRILALGSLLLSLVLFPVCLRQAAVPARLEASALDLSSLWMAPSADEISRLRAGDAGQLVKAVDLSARGEHRDALALLRPDTANTTALAGYARYYVGLSQLALEQFDAARQTFAAVRTTEPRGYLMEAAVLGEAEAASGAGDHRAAARLYEQLLQQQPAAPDDVLLKLAQAAAAAGDRERAAAAYVRVYYEYPLGAAAAAAGQAMRAFSLQPLAPRNGRYRLELARAERLFAAGRWAEAKRSLALVRPHATGDDRELVALRTAACDYHLKRYSAAKSALKPYLTRGARRAEALYYYLLATRAEGDHASYVKLARRLVREFSDTPWAEDTLNHLATHYILVDDDARAAEVFGELLRRYPNSRHAERAAWKAGWWAFKQGRYAEASAMFLDAAARFARSDYRPAFRYWAGLAQQRLGRVSEGAAILATVVAEYGNSYYGRLAASRLGDRLPKLAAPASAVASVDPGTPPPTADLIRKLLALGLYDLAMRELHYARRTWGSSPLLDATIAWVHHQRGELRQAITAAKRAYPFYVSAAGRHLPVELLRVIFPLAYWDLIQTHASAHALDPYVMAALIAQESTFAPDIRSAAGAVGLMQIMPSTGRRLARMLQIPRYRASMLTLPDINVRMGMRHFADLMAQFGSLHLALAAYNAGEYRVGRWLAERPGLAQDEFIDDIPFPETQNYVRKVLGTAEDYRVLYGDPTRITATSGGF